MNNNVFFAAACHTLRRPADAPQPSAGILVPPRRLCQPRTPRGCRHHHHRRHPLPPPPPPPRIHAAGGPSSTVRGCQPQRPPPQPAVGGKDRGTPPVAVIHPVPEPGRRRLARAVLTPPTRSSPSPPNPIADRASWRAGLRSGRAVAKPEGAAARAVRRGQAAPRRHAPDDENCRAGRPPPPPSPSTHLPVARNTWPRWWAPHPP